MKRWQLRCYNVLSFSFFSASYIDTRHDHTLSRTKKYNSQSIDYLMHKVCTVHDSIIYIYLLCSHHFVCQPLHFLPYQYYLQNYIWFLCLIFQSCFFFLCFCFLCFVLECFFVFISAFSRYLLISSVSALQRYFSD